MPYSKWGAKTCTLCEEVKFARTGVCIGCDAGMCKTYFHVTCAQAAGFLSEAHSEEADHADPFYAHCKVHSDKTMIKHRKRNYNILKLRMEQKRFLKEESLNEKPSPEQLRIQRKLTKHQAKYRSNKILKNEPWVPTQKMPRLLTTSATACRRLMLKAELMGIDTAALEFQETQMSALADVRKKWHIPPAFSVEFIGYYLDRISRLRDIKCNLERHMEMNKKLLDEQQTLRDEYDEKIKLNSELIGKNAKLKETVNELHKQIEALCPTKSLPSIDNIGRPVPAPTAIPSPRPMAVPTAAALKMGVGFPLVNLPGTKDDSGRILSTQRQNNDDLVHECGICKRCNDQHLLAKCDTCHFYYHLGCLNPPLTRHPKKSKLYGWQCSECDKSDDSDAIVELPKGPRKSRTRFSKDGTIISADPNASNLEISQPSKSDITVNRKKPTEKMPKREKTSDTDENINQKNLQNNVSPKAGSAVTNKKHKSSSPKIMVHNEVSNHEGSKSTKGEKGEIKTENDEISDSAIDYSDSKLKSKINKKPKREKKFDDEQNNSLYTESITSAGKLNQDNELLKSNIESAIATIDANNSNGPNVEQIQKQNRKRRKEKHKNKYPSDGEKSPSKEHKRKRKKKSHDRDNVNNDSIPKIKIKFKTLPLPGEAAPEPHFFYVSADMVRPLDNSRPTSVETVDDSTMNADDLIQDQSLNEYKSADNSTSAPSQGKNTPTNRAQKAKTKPVHMPSPRRLSKKDLNNTSASENTMCDVCGDAGTNQNLVMCDECEKNYHFTCLDPPLKKTPKRRGYSWHCADCDPTDIEST